MSIPKSSLKSDVGQLWRYLPAFLLFVQALRRMAGELGRQ